MKVLLCELDKFYYFLHKIFSDRFRPHFPSSCARRQPSHPLHIAIWYSQGLRKTSMCLTCYLVYLFAWFSCCFSVSDLLGNYACCYNGVILFILCQFNPTCTITDPKSTTIQFSNTSRFIRCLIPLLYAISCRYGRFVVGGDIYL